MKQVILLALVCCLGLSLHAQDSMTKRPMTHKTTTKYHKSTMKSTGMHKHMKDCVMMEDGKMMSMMNGKTMPMEQDMTMKNGTQVMTDGTVKMKNGKTMTLKNGDCVYMNGTVAHHSMSKMKSKKKM
ncbi:DUF6799 domain-containing protein [Flavisolibacter ginsengisoli]|jgi:hypothetical protein|uniref:DUF6799 domain-containing protein n=1 Tax=Flavisolibacter ginsengisoli DSM 18119 TaxID=1121884 RepID=A0A1M5G613_9BACT|nr:DUF6799 domain-containing protein [Flavisolibacter ginsengisoli]SHF99149.1 hypothetical protein SAMN02745131_04054 [Flavisolibacter ginsengisoli DSM 18119]